MKARRWPSPMRRSPRSSRSRGRRRSRLSAIGVAGRGLDFRSLQAWLKRRGLCPLPRQVWRPKISDGKLCDSLPISGTLERIQMPSRPTVLHQATTRTQKWTRTRRTQGSVLLSSISAAQSLPGKERRSSRPCESGRISRRKRRESGRRLAPSESEKSS
eukprot:666242-Prymnesium_polylepis.1